MKPNFKKSAERYRKLFYDSQERISALLHAQKAMTAHLTEQANELNDLKVKYSEALDKIIALQEKIAKTEEKG